MSKSIARERREAILAKWPPHRQLEALTEAMSGDDGKFRQLTADISAIKTAHPKKEKAA